MVENDAERRTEDVMLDAELLDDLDAYFASIPEMTPESVKRDARGREVVVRNTLEALAAQPGLRKARAMENDSEHTAGEELLDAELLAEQEGTEN